MSDKIDYNKSAEFYDKRYRNTQFEKYRIMLSGLKLRGNILDHGCGTGLLSEFLKRDDLVGCDSSEEMLKIRGSGDQCAVEDLPYEDSEFDFVLSFSVLMNLRACAPVATSPVADAPPPVEKALKEVGRVLKSEGVFVCTFLKSFKHKLKPLLDKHFKIKQELNCGEDVGFILNVKEDTFLNL